MKHILNFIVLSLLSSCGIQRLAVDHADNLLSYQVTRRIPLYSEQKNKFERDIGKFLNSSKTSVSDILPVIDKIELNGSEEIERLYPKLEKFYLNLAEKFSHLMATYMAELDPKQQKDMFEEFDDENRELLVKEKEERIDDLEDRFKSFFDEINGPQKQLFRKHADYFHDRAKKRLDRRLRLHEKLKTIYQQDASSSSRKNSIEEAFKAYQAESTQGNRNKEIINDFLPTLSSKQKEHFRGHVENIKELIKYFLSVDY